MHLLDTILLGSGSSVAALNKVDLFQCSHPGQIDVRSLYKAGSKSGSVP